MNYYQQAKGLIDYDDLYDRLVKNWPNIGNFIEREEIIKKTKSKSHNYNPNRNTKEITYIATIMKSYMAYDYKKNLDRLRIVNNRINKLGIY